MTLLPTSYLEKPNLNFFGVKKLGFKISKKGWVFRFVGFPITAPNPSQKKKSKKKRNVGAPQKSPLWNDAILF